MSLHTNPNCKMAQNRIQTGQVHHYDHSPHRMSNMTGYHSRTVTVDCDAAINFNQGCGTAFTKPNSYGKDLNVIDGGYYVMKKTTHDGISGWFWPRGDNSTPTEVVNSGYTGFIDTDLWEIPDAFFAHSEACDLSSHFDAHSLVFDLTFCVWDYSSGSCVLFLTYHSFLRATGPAVYSHRANARSRGKPVNNVSSLSIESTTQS